jgi:hypothetical protein
MSDPEFHQKAVFASGHLIPTFAHAPSEAESEYRNGTNRSAAMNERQPH